MELKTDLPKIPLINFKTSTSNTMTIAKMFKKPYLGRMFKKFHNAQNVWFGQRDQNCPKNQLFKVTINHFLGRYFWYIKAA